ncbi:MAG: hypothetical protein EZS28_006357 [Streblomastix strix]|uniref:Protein kinase domain-containing protein n=1 Tax=Streblomastix strix TaxID=222440 RepID=A0A5J4WT41_9EUKA|nr:MAG: hypothetical protein EZS28_006357 [Streblomastix strix]
MQTLEIFYEHVMRMERFIPIRPLGNGSFGIFYLVFHIELGIVAVKLIQKYKYDKHEREWESAIQITNKQHSSPFILKYKRYDYNRSCDIITMEYANIKTLEIIAKQPQILLPSYTLHALMKQILQGIKSFHSSGLIHRPPGSGRVYVKISDFGLAKQEDTIYEQTYIKGTLPYQAPELFNKKINSTQIVDIYASGIIFFRLLTRRYPVNERNFKEQGKKIVQLKGIKRPTEIKDDILWDLLSQLLEFDPDKRITAAEALQHPYFTSPEAKNDISKEQQELAQQAADAELEGDSSITEFDKDPTFIVAESKARKNLKLKRKINPNQFMKFKINNVKIL